MITYKIGIDQIEWTKLFELYKKVGLLKRFIENDGLDKIQSAFEKSYKVVTAWEEDNLIGAGRMLSDGVCYANVYDVGVLPEYQGRGIGRDLMKALMKDEEHMPTHLTSTFGNEDFYKKLGFKKHKTALSKYPFDTIYIEG